MGRDTEEDAKKECPTPHGESISLGQKSPS